MILKVDKSKLYRRFQFQWQQEKKFDSSNHWFQLVSKWPYRSNVQVEISENNKSSKEEKDLTVLWKPNKSEFNKIYYTWILEKQIIPEMA